RVREGLPRTRGAVPVGAGPQLHARDEPTLEPQREQHAHEQEDDDPDRLEQPDPPVVVREVRDRVRRGEQRAQGHGVHAVTSVAAFATATTLPPPARSVGRTREPGELPGSHTTWSAIGVTRTGSVIVPCSVLTATCSPSATPSACAVAADSRATGLLAVPARYGSPSWPRPRSSMSRHVARTASPGPTSGTGAAPTTGAAARAPSHAPRCAISACARSAVAIARSTSSSSARAESTR